MNNKLDELIHHIRKSFVTVAKPNDENIIVGDNVHFETCEECRDLRNYFMGQTRELISKDRDAYRQTINAFSFFTPEAWHYYLPVYLIGCLQNEQLRFNDFWHHDEPVVKERLWLKRIELLNAQQCSVLINYLTYIVTKMRSTSDRRADCQRVLNWWQEIYQKTFPPQ